LTGAGSRQTQVDWASPKDLARRSARGGLAVASSSWVRFSLLTAASIALARLLGPSEYGIGAILVIFGGAAELLRESGPATYVVQTKTLNPIVASSLFWWNVLVGFLIVAATLAAGSLIGELFNLPQLVRYLPLIGLMFLAIAVVSIPAAVMARNMEFKQLAFIDLTSTLMGVLIGVFAAVVQGTALALVLQGTSIAVFQCVGTLVACPWKPGKPRLRAATKEALYPSSLYALTQGANYVSRNIDNVIVGVSLGAHATGLYNQAYQFLTMPLQQIGGPLQRVAVPALSRVFHDSERYRRYVRRLLLMITVALWPAYALLAVQAKDLVALLFGPAWAGSASIFMWLAWAGIAQAVGYVNYWLFVSSGQAKRQTVWTLLSRPLVIISFFAGLPWGASGVAAAYALVSLALVLPGFLIARKRAHVTVSDIVGPLAAATMVAVPVLCAGLALNELIQTSTVWLNLLIKIPLLLLVGAAFGYLQPSVRLLARGLAVQLPRGRSFAARVRRAA
jgi:O-antigen/teichoic acid export membrane protein